MRRAAVWGLLVLACCAFWAGVGYGVAQAETEAQPTPAPAPPVAEVVPQAKLVKAVDGWRAARAEVRALRATLRRGPDFDVSLQLAAIAYGQDWRALRRCALSEGAREAERFARFNRRPNSQGSGAFSSFQFMRGTFLSTPFGALDWARQDVQAFAAAWMFAEGRSDEWTGAGC